MGSHRERSEPVLTRVAQVVPAIPSFAVDDGFAYTVPDHLSGIDVGSIVRVPIGSRRLRGWVVGMRSRDGDRKLRDIISVSGARQIFDERLVHVLRWASLHYVAPLSVVLPKAGPPNLPGSGRVVKLGAVPEQATEHRRFVDDLLSGRRPRMSFQAGSGGWASVIAGVAAPVITAERNVLVVVPSNREVDSLGDELSAAFGGGRVLAVGTNADPKTTTAAWVGAAVVPGRVVVGTREAAYWGIPGLGVVVCVEPGRRVMKSPQTPTIDTGTLLRRRSAIERFGLLFLGQVPPVEVVAAGAVVLEGPRRSWSLVEVIDRGEEPPGSGVVMEATKRAVSSALRRGHRVFALVNRRGYAPAVRCARCRTVRTCPTCGASPGRAATCERCGAPNGPCAKCGGERFEPLGAGIGRVVDELRRSFGDAVGPAPGDLPVQVGTERDLLAVGQVDLAVALDVDGLLLAPNYRAEEEALRILSRLASHVRGGSGSRMLLQTAQPNHHIVQALRRGRGLGAVEHLRADRADAGFPPSRELLALEVIGDAGVVDADLEALGGGVEVLGPAESNGRWRWLIQADDLKTVRVSMRTSVQAWRDAGYRVRVDVDPIDL